MMIHISPVQWYHDPQMRTDQYINQPMSIHSHDVRCPDFDPMLVVCRSSVVDAGPTFNQHWSRISCFLVNRYHFIWLFISQPLTGTRIGSASVSGWILTDPDRYQWECQVLGPFSLDSSPPSQYPGLPDEHFIHRQLIHVTVNENSRGWDG